MQYNTNVKECAIENISCGNLSIRSMERQRKNVVKQ